MSSTFSAPRGSGRHRAGRPGLIPVTAFVSVVRRGFFAAFFRPGRHRFEHPATPQRVTASPVPA